MARCQVRWVDPAPGATPVGPFSCGRFLSHKGVHAHDGHGASALWDREGNLLMAIQAVKERQPDNKVKPALAAPTGLAVEDLSGSLDAG